MIKKLFRGILTVAIGTAFIIGNTSYIAAQEDNQYEFTLEEITVTAQKREENQQKVAIAMDVITMEDIQGMGKNDLDEILSNISGVLIQTTSDGLRISIRGMSDNSSPQYGQSVGTPTVAINTDGVFSNRKDTGNSLYDLERVEVLYGPQSTMYASNSPGGIVNIVTAAPKVDRFSVKGSIEYGNYNYLHTDGALNAPLNDKAAVRVSFATSKRGSYIEGNDENVEDSKSARVRALYQPGDNFSIIATVERSKTGGSGAGQNVVAFADQDDVDDPWTANDNSGKIGSNDMTADKISATIKWDTSLGSITFVPSYSTRGGDNVNVMMEGGDPNSPSATLTATTVYQSQKAREKGAELRIASPSDFFFKWIAGATYYKSKDTQHRESEDYVEDPTTGYWTYTGMGEKMRALFANITYPVTDTFRFTLGYRQSWDTMTSDNYESQKEEYWSHRVMENSGKPDYKIGFEYDLGENSMLYGDYSTSYRVTGMESAALFDEEEKQEPEKLRTYTLGSKNRFFDNKLQANISAYYNDYHNFMVKEIAMSTLPSGEMYRETAYILAQGYMWGFDLQTNAIITSSDILNVSVSYIKSAWDHLFFDYLYAEDLDYNGVPISNTPPWTWNATYNHNFYLWNGGALNAGITLKYQTGYRLTWKDDDLPYSYQETHHMENLNIAYSHYNGKWSLSGYVNNIFNYAEKRYYGASGGGGLTIGSPRTFGAVLSVTF